MVPSPRSWFPTREIFPSFWGPERPSPDGRRCQITSPGGTYQGVGEEEVVIGDLSLPKCFGWNIGKSLCFVGKGNDLVMARDGNWTGGWTKSFFGGKHPDIWIYCYTCGNFLTPTAHLARSFRHRKLRWSFFQGRKPQKHSKNSVPKPKSRRILLKLPDLTCSNQFFLPSVLGRHPTIPGTPWFQTSEVASRTLNQLGVPWWTLTFSPAKAVFFAERSFVFFKCMVILGDQTMSNL